MHVAICGGTGPVGGELTRALVRAGHTVTIGSRSLEKARAAVAELDLEGVDAAENAHACAKGKIVVLAVPWDAAEALARKCAPDLSGKIVISMANAIVFVDGRPQAVIPQSGSVALAVQMAVPSARVVAALHHVPAKELAKGAEADVLICADDDGAAEEVEKLLDGVEGLDGIRAGGLAMSAAVEAFTAVLVSVNQINKGRARLKLFGLPGRPE